MMMMYILPESRSRPESPWTRETIVICHCLPSDEDDVIRMEPTVQYGHWTICASNGNWTCDPCITRQL